MYNIVIKGGFDIPQAYKPELHPKIHHLPLSRSREDLPLLKFGNIASVMDSGRQGNSADVFEVP